MHKWLLASLLLGLLFSSPVLAELPSGNLIFSTCQTPAAQSQCDAYFVGMAQGMIVGSVIDVPLPQSMSGLILKKLFEEKIKSQPNLGSIDAGVIVAGALVEDGRAAPRR